jgi:hypothetical protein
MTPCSCGFALKMFKGAGANLQFAPVNQGFAITFIRQIGNSLKMM